MLYASKASTYMNDLLLRKEKEIERNKKILADHNERIRILELAIQGAIKTEISLYSVCVGPDLEKALIESHKIALKEYP